jgi:hypothetical protein
MRARALFKSSSTNSKERKPVFVLILSFYSDAGNEAINDTQEADYALKHTNTFEKKTITIQQADKDSVNLKDFNIIERLGKGSFGSVYFVEKLSDKQIHAMKVLEKEKILK